MCRAVYELTPEQRGVFEAVHKELEHINAASRLSIINALREHVELTLLAQRPYDQPHRVALSPAT